MSKLDHFEESLKNSIDGFEVPFNSSDWDKLNDRLDLEQGGSGSKTAKYLGILAGALLAGGALFYAFTDENTLADNANISQHVVESDAVNTQSTSNSAEETGIANYNNERGSLINNESTDSKAHIDISHGQKSASFESESTSDFVVKVVPNETRTVRNDAPVNNSTNKSSSISEDGSVVEENSTVKGPKVTYVNPKDEVQPRLEAISTHNGEISKGGHNSNELGFNATVKSSCAGSNVSFQVDKVTPGTIYLWNFGDGAFSNEAEPEHVYNRAGLFKVTLVRTGGAEGQKIQSAPATDEIEIFASPDANFNFVPRSELKKLPYIHFENISTSATDWVWDFGDGITSKESHPDHVYKKAGTYSVKLTVQNGNGCTDELSKTVTVTNDNPLQAPKTFSPNGDGVKDVFLPEALKEINSSFKFSVYEKTGALVFTSYNTAAAWNGEGANGKIVPAGEYVWMVDFTDGEYRDSKFQGTVSLLH